MRRERDIQAGACHHLVARVARRGFPFKTVCVCLVFAVLGCDVEVPGNGGKEHSTQEGLPPASFAANEEESKVKPGADGCMVVFCLADEEAMRNLIWCEKISPERYRTEGGDAEQGTIREIEEALCEKLKWNDWGLRWYEVSAISCAVHTEAFYLDGCLLVLAWKGDIRGNYFDVRIRTYSPLDKGIADTYDLPQLYRSTSRYSKCEDKEFKSVTDVALFRKDGQWIVSISGDLSHLGFETCACVLSCRNGCLIPTGGFVLSEAEFESPIKGWVE